MRVADWMYPHCPPYARLTRSARPVCPYGVAIDIKTSSAAVARSLKVEFNSTIMR